MATRDKVDLLEAGSYPAGMGSWIVRLPSSVEAWLMALPEDVQDALLAAIEVLEEYGPSPDLPQANHGTLDQGLSISLLDGGLIVGYRPDVVAHVITLTGGHAYDWIANAPSVSRLTHGLAMLDQVVWEVDDAPLQ